MAEVVWTERATAWLRDIYDYIAQDNPAAAARTVEAIQKKTLLLAEFPELGYRYERWPERNLRIILYGHYRIPLLGQPRGRHPHHRRIPRCARNGSISDLIFVSKEELNVIMPKILVLDELSQDGLSLLEAAGNLDVEVRIGLKGEELHKALLDADGAICRSGVKITADALQGNTRLRAIARAGVGVDNIDTKAATRQGIVVMNTPGGNTISTAEHTIALMLALSRNIAPANQSLIEGRWDRKKFMGAQLAGKTLGVIGLGRVGQAVATRARGLEMRILGYDPFLPSSRAKELGIETCESAREMLPLVDYLSVHTPLNDATKNLIGLSEARMLKKGARLINCARGGIFDEAALLEGLRRADRSPASPWTCSRKSPARRTRCSACPACFARRTSAPAPRRLKPA